MAGRLHDLAELDVRGAGGLAGTADEGELEMGLHLLGDGQRALGDGADQVEAPTRRIRLQAVGAVGGALVKAEPAVHALDQRLVIAWFEEALQAGALTDVYAVRCLDLRLGNSHDALKF